MLKECRDKIGATAGRPVSNKEGDGMRAALRSKMASLRNSQQYKDVWARLTHEQRAVLAAQAIAKDVKEKAEITKYKRRKQAIAQDRIVRELDRLNRDEDHQAFCAIADVLRGIERTAKGIQNEFLSSMLDTLNGIGSYWLGLVENAQDVHDFVREVYGFPTGNARAHAAAQAWTDTSEAIRARAHAAGAEIGRIPYGYLPQSHDWWRIRKEGFDAWYEFILPRLDRDRYVDENGDRLEGRSLRESLYSTYEKIITSGHEDSNIFNLADSIKTRVMGYEVYESRNIHLDGPDAFLEYEGRFGRSSMTGSIIGYVSRMSQDIAIMETLGPRPEAAFDMMKQVADGQAKNARTEETRWRLLTKYSDWQGLTDASVDDMWAVLKGTTSTAAVNREGVANFMSGWRNLEVAGKLGKAFISSFSDIPSYFIATGFNRLDFMDSFTFLFAAYGSDWKDFASRAGLIADSIASDFNRWAADNLGQGWTAKMANFTMKASFLTAFTDATRRAFGLTMMSSLGKMIDKNWDQLDTYDRARLQQAGIDEETWGCFQRAGAEEYRGHKFLTIEQLRRIEIRPDDDPAAIQALPGKLLGFIISESEMASLGADITTRAQATRGLQRGTLKGELVRAFYLFKSFPIAMMEKHFRRAMFLHQHGDMVDQLGYLAGLTVATTVFGAISLQVQQLLNGKDMEDMETPKFWLEALAKGGGLGFIGDWLANGLSDDARYGAMSGLTNFAGPQIGTAVEVSDLATAALGSAIYDRETKPAVKAIKLTRSHLPFLNMWYTSTAIDRAFMNDLQEYLSPGYMRRMEQRMRRGTGQQYWLPQDSLTPTRAPKMAEAPSR